MITTHFTNEYGANLHKSIKDGKTLVYDNQMEAESKAREIRRYAFPIYENGKTNGYWAVPK